MNISLCNWFAACWLALTALAGCELGPEQAGSFFVAFTWSDGHPGQQAWVSARVEQVGGGQRLQVAEAPLVMLQPGVQLAFPSVQHGDGYVVVVEIKEEASKAARTVFFGESRAFKLEPGKRTRVEVALALTRTPSAGGVSIVEANERGYVNTQQVTLALSASGAARVIAANNFALTKGRRESSLQDLEQDRKSWLWRDWPLDAELCPRAPCPDEARTIYVQFVNDKGYLSEVSSVTVRLDRALPTLAGASLAPLVAKVNDQVTLVVNPSEPLRSAPVLREEPLHPGFSAFQPLSGGAYVADYVPSASGMEREELTFSVELVDLAGNKNSVAIPDRLVIDQKAPALLWGADIQPSLVRDGDVFTLSFELDEVARELPVVRVADTRVDCTWDGVSMRLITCEHTASQAEGGGTKEILVEVYDAAGNFAALAAGTMIYDTLPRCGDGVRDPDRSEACDEGKANSNAPNAKCRTNCQPQRCGDRVVDALRGETCDDGNLESADGCSYDCKSNETCPNGYVDFSLGEECDDGDLQSHDGCTHECAREVPTWTPRTSVGPLGPFVSAYDVARDALVVFVGGNTWEWRAGRWSKREIAGTGPSARSHHTMAYDAARQRVVLFGGENAKLDLSDTWEWDGKSWTQVAGLADGPGARSNAAMAYDAGRQRVVLFGDSKYSDTWEWDGGAWAKVHEGTTDESAPDPSSPPGSDNPAMAYDAKRGVVVMFGGAEPMFDLRNDTWAWDGKTWTKLFPKGDLPPARTQHGMAYDARSQRIIIFGGYNSEYRNLGDFWAWDGADWTALPGVEPQPTLRREHTLTYDVARSRIVLAGGVVDTEDTTQTDTNDDGVLDLVDVGDVWEWDGNGWQSAARSDLPEPSFRSGAGMIYDAGRGRVVLFGGTNELVRMKNPHVKRQSIYFNDTWEWDGSGWTSVGPRGQWWWGTDGWSFIDSGSLQQPSPRRGHAMGYDPLRRVTTLFGGVGSSDSFCQSRCRETAHQDTWEWNGQVWTLRNPDGPLPPAGDGSAMVFDVARGQLLLFGGSNDGTLAMWVWDGARWILSPAVSPAPIARTGHSLTYDAARGRVVLLGGVRWKSTPGVWLHETWEWDGAHWEQKAINAASPAARIDAAFTYDASVGQSVLFGGRAKDNASLNDTWHWDGRTWSQLQISGAVPDRRHSAAMAYDAAHAQIVMSGLLPVISEGISGGFDSGDTWTLRWEGNARDETCRIDADADADGLAGCEDPDCFGVCSPYCNPTLASCEASDIGCGDGQCSGVEDCQLCPQDCSICAPTCGDFRCDPSEDAVSCPGDCAR